MGGGGKSVQAISNTSQTSCKKRTTCLLNLGIRVFCWEKLWSPMANINSVSIVQEAKQLHMIKEEQQIIQLSISLEIWLQKEKEAVT